MTRRDPAARAIRLLVDMQTELEQAGCPDGEIIQMTRQQNDALVNSAKEIARLVREMEERL
jgi:hypothetical protein